MSSVFPSGRTLATPPSSTSSRCSRPVGLLEERDSLEDTGHLLTVSDGWRATLPGRGDLAELTPDGEEPGSRSVRTASPPPPAPPGQSPLASHEEARSEALREVRPYVPGALSRLPSSP